MKTTLDQLTVNQFLELLCGNTGVLKSSHEIASDIKLSLVARDIIFQYKDIADHAGMARYLSSAEDMFKANLETIIFEMCTLLIAGEEYDMAREVLDFYGINVSPMDDRRLAAEIKSRLGRAKMTIAKLEDNSVKEERSADTRRLFEAQTADLMAYFKFQIDTDKMKASTYAHLVARHDREIKAQIAAMNKSK